MLIVEDIISNQRSAVFLSIIFAEDVLHIFEEKHPNNSKPRKAINASKEWLNGGCSAAEIYLIAEDAFFFAFDHAAADAAAYTAYIAARATSYVRRAIYAADAASAAKKEVRSEYTHNLIKENLFSILRFHIKEEIPFENPEKVFAELSDEDKKEMIFHMDILS